MDVKVLRETLQNEINELELERVRVEERLAEKRRTIRRLDGSQGVNGNVRALPHPVPGRKTITTLQPHNYEVGILRFKTPGEVLDHFGIPHYYSKKSPGKKDAAAREILRWAKQDPNQARTVTVVLTNGTSMDLYMAATTVSP